MNGAALKLSSNILSATDIVNQHYSILKKKGIVYFSTDIQFSVERCIDQLLLVFKHKSETKYVVANVLEKRMESEPFVPSDANSYSPSMFSNEPKRSWFKLTTMNVVDDLFIENCVVNYSDGAEKRLKDVLQYPRFNRCYYSVVEASEDLLIK